MTGVLSSIQIGLPRTYTHSEDDDGQPKKWRTGFYKAPILSPVRVRRLGIDGDGQANLDVHGGPDLPILAYCGDHYPRWQSELKNPQMLPGGFAENFTIDSGDAPIDEKSVCIGDQFQIGDIVVEVSQPREPCFKLQRRWNNPQLAQRVLEHDRGGWYFRVLTEGFVSAGAAVHRMANPFPRWTIAAAMRVMYHGKKDPLASASLSECPALSLRWKRQMQKRLAQPA